MAILDRTAWLELGLKRFAESGIKGLVVNDMSNELNISKTSFYNFFGSKEEYINQLLEYWFIAGTVNITKEGLLQMDPANSVHYIMEHVVYDNYINEKFLTQLIGAQKGIPAAKKYTDDVINFRRATCEGLLTRLGVNADEARERAKNIVIYFMGLTELYFAKEPSDKEKSEILNTILRLFWPEVL